MKSNKESLLLSGTLYKLIVYGNVVLYSICWMAQVPVMPYLVEKLGTASSAQYGTLQTIFSAVQFVGGLISGPLMDRYGGRFLLAASFAASVASYGLTATASSVWMLYFSRIPTVLQHAVLAARAIVTQLSSEADRARVLGYVAVSYSVGFMVGPAVGGLLSAVSLQFAAWVATLGSAISLATVLLLLPDLPAHAAEGHKASSGTQHRKHHGQQEQQQEPAGNVSERKCRLSGNDDGVGSIGDSGSGSIAGFSASGTGGAAPEQEDRSGGSRRLTGGPQQMLMQFVEVARRPGALDLLAGKLLVGLGSAVFQSLFPVLLKRRYGLDPRTNGMVMSYVGALLLGGQALLVGPVIAVAGEPATEYGCVVALVVTNGALAAAGSLWQLLVLLVPLSVAGMLYNNASTSRLTKATLPQQRGTALAIDMSLSSGVRMLSPALGAAVYDRFGHRAVPTLAAMLIGSFLIAVQLGVFRIPTISKAAETAKAAAAGGRGSANVGSSGAAEGRDTGNAGGVGQGARFPVSEGLLQGIVGGGGGNRSEMEEELRQETRAAEPVVGPATAAAAAAAMDGVRNRRGFGGKE